MSDSPEKPSVPETPTPPAAEPKVETVPVSPGKMPLATPKSGGITQGLHTLWTVIFRLGLLGVSVGIGWLVGVLVAQVFPAQNPEPPLSEVWLRQASQSGRKLSQLPQWWRGEPATDGANLLETDNGVATSPERGATSPPTTLSEADQARLAEELPDLQQELESLDNQLAELESAVGQPTTGTVEARLRRLEQQAQAPQAEENPDPAAPATEESEATETMEDDATPAPLAVYQEPRFSRVTDRVVLPSSLLFAPNDNWLTPAGKQLLDTILPDLSQYSGATLIIGSHAGGEASAVTYRQLTFQQSQAVQQYLAQYLGDEMRWVVVGYGDTRPRVQGGTAADRQRNQRVEIGIVPN
jgi:outer membrane protein OmpA-like peptidoglycan-associated protein